MLALYVKKSFDDSDETYGYRRVHADLAGWGVPAGPELVRSVMRELGLEPCQPRPWRFSLTEGDGQEHVTPPTWCTAISPRPGEKMVGDITYSDVAGLTLPGHGHRLPYESRDRLGG
jgi:putative transposase